ncbi:MAG: hypothetical protein ING32_12500 [Curvibacter sp.]|jgi:hypothetical protein|nr:hypothetical protein [Curvibacter sp.]
MLRWLSARDILVDFHSEHRAMFLLIAAPALFLFAYSIGYPFYRSVYINPLVVFALILLLPELLPAWDRTLSWVGRVVVVCVLLSILINNVNFWRVLRDYPAPSLPLSTRWSDMASKVDSMRATCAPVGAGGNVVVDDLTYQNLRFMSGTVHPITYLGLQGLIIQSTTDGVLDKVKPDWVLARCDLMRDLKIGWPADARAGEVCCRRFHWGP